MAEFDFLKFNFLGPLLLVYASERNQTGLELKFLAPESDFMLF